MSEWTIEFHQRSILGGTHHFWAMRNEKGRIERELHGFATEPDGRVKSTGWPWQTDDHIGVYDIDRKALNSGAFWDVLRRNFDAEYQVEPHAVVFKGAKADALSKWRNATRIAAPINAAKIGYRVVGLSEPAENSNAVAYTFGKAMGVVPPPLKDPRTGKETYRPGWGKDLMETLRKRRSGAAQRSRKNQIRTIHEYPEGPDN